MTRPYFNADGERDTALARAREFFKNNPDEVLTRSDMQVKFACGEHTASLVARALIREGIATRDQLPRRLRPPQPKLERRRRGSLPLSLSQAQVETLEAVMQHGNLAAAARAMGRNYNTMTDQMHKARKQLGVHTTAELASRYQAAVASSSERVI